MHVRLIASELRATTDVCVVLKERTGCLVSAANSFGPLSGLAVELMTLELAEDC